MARKVKWQKFKIEEQEGEGGKALLLFNISLLNKLNSYNSNWLYLSPFVSSTSFIGCKGSSLPPRRRHRRTVLVISYTIF